MCLFYEVLSVCIVGHAFSMAIVSPINGVFACSGPLSIKPTPKCKFLKLM